MIPFIDLDRIEPPDGGVQSSLFVRLRSLDGLRGFASLTVVFTHSLIVSPVFFAALYESIPARRWSLSWWLGHPPLNLIWAGQQAVIVFFVLSGMVVSLPFVKGKGSWIGYYPRRFIRIYLPVWAAVGFAVIVAELVHRHAVTGASLWLSAHSNPHWTGVQRDLKLYHGTDLLDGPLWTLRWEVIFSALLPIYVLFARVLPRASIVKIVLMLGAIGIGVKTQHNSLLYLPAFGAGAALAGDLDGLARMADWMQGRRALSWLLLIVAGVLIEARSILEMAGKGGPSLFRGEVMTIGIAAGAIMLVALTIVTSPLRSACASRVGQWLGKQSFSLYLVHEPIVVSVGLLLGKGASVALILLLSVPISLLTSWAFQYVVEGPALNLSRTVGHGLTRLAQRNHGAEASGVA
jgi:peptidoglycan/LPS O-acetylase OafA/YrhL